MLLIFTLLAAAAALAFCAPPPRKANIAYGGVAALMTLAAGGLIALVALPLQLPDIAAGAAVAAAAAAAAWHARQMRRKNERARRGYERVARAALVLAATVAVVTTVGIVASVLVESARFFKHVNVADFLFGLRWSPQISIREDQVGASGAFGFVPLITGTLLISGVAMFVAAPMGLLSAVYLSEFASRRARNRIKPLLEILAGIPTIVYGFFAVAVLSPLLKDLGDALAVGIAGESALAAGLVMGFMLIPFVASLAEDAFFAVPAALRQGSFGLGATRYETTVNVVVPAAFPGIVAGMLLATSRAIGETMIVVMAAGISARLSINPLEAVTTVTVQIVTLLTGDQEFDDPKTLAAFALGFTLFFVTLLFNLAALHIARKYRERYE